MKPATSFPYIIIAIDFTGRKVQHEFLSMIPALEQYDKYSSNRRMDDVTLWFEGTLLRSTTKKEE